MHGDESTERRQNGRHESLNLVSFSILGPEGNLVGRGTARTLNVSHGGMLLESVNPIAAGQVLSLAIGLDEALTEIRGKVAHVTEAEGRHRIGVAFVDVGPEEAQALQAFLVAFEQAMA